MSVERDQYPKCESCRQVNGDPAGTRHRQVHVSAHGKQSCVDEHLTGLMVALWEVADTTDSGADHDGRAYVVPTPDTAPAAEGFLTGLGLAVDNNGGTLHFRVPEQPHQHPALEDPLPAPAAAPPLNSAADILPTLHRLTERVAEIRNMFATVTTGVPHPRISSTADSLDQAQRDLVASMRAYAKPFQRWSWRTGAPMQLLEPAVVVLPVWLATVAAAALAGGSVAWMVVAALAAYGLIGWPYLRLTRRLSDVLTRRRIRRALADPTWDASMLATPDTATDQQDRSLSLICVELLDIYHAVNVIRTDLAAVGRIQLGGHPTSLHGSGAGLIRATNHDPALSWLIDADSALANAGDNIRLWLSLPRG